MTASGGFMKTPVVAKLLVWISAKSDRLNSLFIKRLAEAYLTAISCCPKEPARDLL